jgi:hypothetical protein
MGYGRDRNGTLYLAHFHWGRYHLDTAEAMFRSNQQLDLISHQPEEWVKAFDPARNDKTYLPRNDPKAPGLKVTSATPTKGDFRSTASRDVVGLRGALVKLTPRHIPESDRELVGIVQRLCERYANSLKGFTGLFRSPSAESKSAQRQLQTMLGLACDLSVKANDLRDMLRHFRKDPKTTAAHPAYGKPVGTTFRKYINEAFAGREYLLV